jgi:hypothetical protein
MKRMNAVTAITSAKASSVPSWAFYHGGRIEPELATGISVRDILPVLSVLNST